MPGITRRAARKTARTVRTVARQPRNLVGVRRQTYPSGGGKAGSGICLVRLTEVGTDKQTTASAIVLKASYQPPEEEDPQHNIPVVVEDTERTIIVANPRGNFLEVGMVYFAFSIASIWIIDNQAVFQEFMGSEGSDE